LFALLWKGNTFVHKTFDDFPAAAAKCTAITTAPTTTATTTTSQLLFSYFIALMGNF